VTMRSLPFPDWQPLYHEAVFELNPEKLTRRVAAARNTIYARLATLGDQPANARERKALRDALDVLDIVLEIEGQQGPNDTANKFQNSRPVA